MENLVRTTTKKAVEKAELVEINREKINALAKKLAKRNLVPPAWPKKMHLGTKNEKQLLVYLIVLDSLNFCFWSKKKKWGIYYKNNPYNGYFALSLALKKFFEESPNKANFEYFSKISFLEFKKILTGDGRLELLEERCNILKAVSRVFIKKYQGDSKKFVLAAEGKAEKLVWKIANELPFFNDVALYKNQKVYFLKRAQILVGDIWGAFGGKGIGSFSGMDYLTAFSDYKLPQILSHFGVLEYDKKLEEKIKKRIIIKAGSKEEIEIRSATIWAVEYLKEALKKEGRDFYSFQVDWFLWNDSQKIKMAFPYHLTRSIFY